MCNGISLRPDDHPGSWHGSVSFCPPCAVKQRSLSYISFEGVIYINCDNRFAHLHWWRRDLRSTLTSYHPVCLRDTLKRIHIFLLYLHLYRSLIYMDHPPPRRCDYCQISVISRAYIYSMATAWPGMDKSPAPAHVSSPNVRNVSIYLSKGRPLRPFHDGRRQDARSDLNQLEQSVWRTFLAQHHTDGLYLMLESGSPNKLPTLQVIQLLMNITCTCSIHPTVHVITTITIIIIFNIRRCVGLEWISAPFSAIFIQNFKLFHIRYINWWDGTWTDDGCRTQGVAAAVPHFSPQLWGSLDLRWGWLSQSIHMVHKVCLPS